MYSVPSSPCPPGPAIDRPSPSPTSSAPSPFRRLRRLSYLRSYTHNHLLSRDSHSQQGQQGNTDSNLTSSQRPSILRSASHPSPSPSPSSPPAPAGSAAAATLNPSQTVPKPLRSPTEISSQAPTSTFTYTSQSTSGQPAVGAENVVSPGAAHLQSPAAASPPAVASQPSASAAALMARTRSAMAEQSPDMSQADGGGEPATQNGGASATNGMAHQLPSIRFTAHQDPRASRPSLSFSHMARVLPTGGEIIKVGRYSERDVQPLQASKVPSAAPVGFKSKVVSRRHCEFWCSNGRWFIKDVKSSSGTFLNHIRLSSPGTESKPYPVNDGDIVQLGIDFKGGEEMIFRCVKIRVELNKGWQVGPSSFNVQSHKRLRELSNQNKASPSGSSQDCSICLGPIAPCQSLFVAPCSHTWHYKCIRVIINGPHWPHFVCPNCRSVADLEAELEEPLRNSENADWEKVQAADASPAVKQSEEPAREANNEPAESLIVAETQRPELDQNEQSEVVGTTSDESQDVNQVADDLEYIHIEESPSPASSTNSQPNQISNSTVAPVDIRMPRGTHLERPNHRMNERPQSRSPSRNFSRPHLGHDSPPRTPSPNAMPASLNGPMTPKNDVGPFVFDGSAGQAIQTDPDETAETPHSTPQPELVHAS